MMSELLKIGEKCLHRRRVGESFREGECVGHDGCFAIIRDKADGAYTGCRDYQLCPIKSEAEKRRERDIEELTANICNMSDMHLVPASLLASRLYKAGCRMTHKLTDDEVANKSLGEN